MSRDKRIKGRTELCVEHNLVRYELKDNLNIFILSTQNKQNV